MCSAHWTVRASSMTGRKASVGCSDILFVPRNLASYHPGELVRNVIQSRHLIGSLGYLLSPVIRYQVSCADIVPAPFVVTLATLQEKPLEDFPYFSFVNCCVLQI